MPELFTPLALGSHLLANRIVLAPTPSGHSTADGFATPPLIEHYTQRACGGVALILSEPILVTPPDYPQPHLGAYADVFVPGLRELATTARSNGARIFFTLRAPALHSGTVLAPLREAFLMAGWRAIAAGADGVMLSAADGGALQLLLSPLHNRRCDRYGGSLEGRLRFLAELLEAMRERGGRQLLLGVRMFADELVPGGMSLQDSRVVAKRLVAAGAHLLDVTAPSAGSRVALFPGWSIPLASSIKRVVDVPVIGSGLLDDPYLADSVIRDGSVDLVMLGRVLQRDPDWPRTARLCLTR